MATPTRIGPFRALGTFASIEIPAGHPSPRRSGLCYRRNVSSRPTPPAASRKFVHEARRARRYGRRTARFTATDRLHPYRQKDVHHGMLTSSRLRRPAVPAVGIGHSSSDPRPPPGRSA